MHYANSRMKCTLYKVERVVKTSRMRFIRMTFRIFETLKENKYDAM